MGQHQPVRIVDVGRTTARWDRALRRMDHGRRVSCGAAYCVASWHSPNRPLMVALLVARDRQLARGGRLDAERIVRSRWREPFFLTWSLLDIAFIATLVALDGGARSPIAPSTSCRSCSRRCLSAAGGLADLPDRRRRRARGRRRRGPARLGLPRPSSPPRLAAPPASASGRRATTSAAQVPRRACRAPTRSPTRSTGAASRSGWSPNWTRALAAAGRSPCS